MVVDFDHFSAIEHLVVDISEVIDTDTTSIQWSESN